jgi:hypothetical protein
MQVTVAPNSSRFSYGTARSESKGAAFAFAALVELSTFEPFRIQIIKDQNYLGDNLYSVILSE